MAVMLMAKAFHVKVGSAGKKLVLLKLADNANDNGECWPSYQHIADQCEISRRSAMNYINQLIQDGLIKKTSRKGPKGNSTNMYVLNLDGANVALGSAADSLGGEQDSLGGEVAAPGGGEGAAPGICHSFESVNESVNEPIKGSTNAEPARKDSHPEKFTDEDFEKFWVYCRDHWFGKPGHKAEARKEFFKLNPKKDDLREILQLTRKECDFRRRVEAQEGFCENMKHICRWIKVRGWEDTRERLTSRPNLSIVRGSDPTQVNRPYRPAMPKPDRAPRPTGTGGAQ